MDIVDTPAINVLVQSCPLLALCIYLQPRSQGREGEDPGNEVDL